MSLMEIEKAINFIKNTANAKPIKVKSVTIPNDTMSLVNLMTRYNIAKPFKYDISLDSIRFTYDVMTFIKKHNLLIDSTKTRLSFKGDE